MDPWLASRYAGVEKRPDRRRTKVEHLYGSRRAWRRTDEMLRELGRRRRARRGALALAAVAVVAVAVLALRALGA